MATEQEQQRESQKPKKRLLQILQTYTGKIVRVFYIVHSISGEPALFMQYRMKKDERGNTVSEPLGTSHVSVDEGVLLYVDDEVLKLKQEVISVLQKEGDRFVTLDLTVCHVVSFTYLEKT